MISAMLDLKPNTFKIWLYLLSNRQSFEVIYSPALISKQIGVSINTCRNAFTELNEKGYIIENKYNKNYFEFYETPQKRSVINLMKEKRRFIDNETGEIFLLTYAELLDNIGDEIEAQQLWEDAE